MREPLNKAISKRLGWVERLSDEVLSIITTSGSFLSALLKFMNAGICFLCGLSRSTANEDVRIAILLDACYSRVVSMHAENSYG